MKAIVIFATIVALGNAWVLLPGNPPIGIPGERPLPPGISPEVPVVPPKPELPKPQPPHLHPAVDSHILNFPSDDDPQVRVHVNIKHENQGHAGSQNRPNYRPIRSLLPPTNGPQPEIGNRPNPIYPPQPEYPGIGNKPEIGWGLPGLPEINLPEQPSPPGNLPEVPPPAELPNPILPPKPEEDAPMVFIYPNTQHQLVKLRVQYNEPEENVELPPPEWAPYKLEWSHVGNKPAPGFPEVDPIFPEIPEGPGNLPGPEENPIIPMPPPTIGGHKQPQVELFLDIGEQEEY